MDFPERMRFWMFPEQSLEGVEVVLLGETIVNTLL